MEAIRWLFSYFVDSKPGINHFEELPKELTSFIFSFVSTFQDLAKLGRVCKGFYLEICDERHWKRLCIEWWKSRGREERILYQIIEECYQLDENKGWRWLGKAVGRGYWRQRTEHKSIEIGEFVDGLLHGWGVQLLDNGSQFVGYFYKGMQCGYGLFMTKEDNGEHRYRGGFLDDEFDGFGVYLWPNGKHYEGEFKKGNSHGKGIMTWRTGFIFSGQFMDDTPLDRENCIHPELKACMREGRCTGSVTKSSFDYGQFLIQCLTCESSGYCAVCWANRCHSHEVGKEEWVDGGYCACLFDVEKCKARAEEDVEPPPKKLKSE